MDQQCSKAARLNDGFHPEPTPQFTVVAVRQRTRGRGEAESRGLITATGLRPQEFAVDRGSRERREVAYFDWETGIVTLHEQKTAAMELPTFDPLAVLWQFCLLPS